MTGFRIGAAILALALPSYAAGQVPEGLGAPVGLTAGRTPATAHALPPGLLEAGAARGAAARYGQTLRRLAPDTQALTRGANETRVYQRAAQAVVLIVTRDGLGSGVLVAADGKIVTNLHVVGSETEVGVVFKPDVEGQAIGKADVRAAKVLRRDAVADLALIQVAEVPPGRTPLVIGNSTTVEVGADVHAIGHPTGEAWTYTRGIVSQIRRAYAWTTDKIAHEATVIQTQTPLNPGNSGGPLLDDNLSVLGINSFIGDGEGLNYAVSAEDVKSFLARTEDRGAIPTPANVCEGKVLQEEPSNKPKGMTYLRDSDCDGQGDALITVPASKREPITIFADEDGDGKYDALYFDDDHDGDPEVALYDTDGNDKPDLRAFFRKGEDEAYRWEKVAE